MRTTKKDLKESMRNYFKPESEDIIKSISKILVNMRKYALLNMADFELLPLYDSKTESHVFNLHFYDYGLLLECNFNFSEKLVYILSFSENSDMKNTIMTFKEFTRFQKFFLF